MKDPREDPPYPSLANRSVRARRGARLIRSPTSEMCPNSTRTGRCCSQSQPPRSSSLLMSTIQWVLLSPKTGMEVKPTKPDEATRIACSVGYQGPRPSRSVASATPPLPALLSFSTQSPLRIRPRVTFSTLRRPGSDVICRASQLSGSTAGRRRLLRTHSTAQRKRKK